MRYSTKRVKVEPAPEFFYWRNPAHEVDINESRAIIYDWNSVKDTQPGVEGKVYWFFCPYIGTVCGESELLEAVSLVVNDGMASRYATQENIAAGIWYGFRVPRGSSKPSEDKLLALLKGDIESRRAMVDLD